MFIATSKAAEGAGEAEDAGPGGSFTTGADAGAGIDGAIEARPTYPSFASALVGPMVAKMIFVRRVAADGPRITATP